MLVATNAYPKSGTHALQKALMLLGVETEPWHLPYPQKLEGQTHHIFIKRDPRNIIASTIRSQGKPIAQGPMLIHLRDGFMDRIGQFTPWLTDPDTLVVSYEALIADDAEMRRIAEHLSIPYLDDAFPRLPGITLTWSYPHVDYRDGWGEQAAAEWEATGGNELLTAWGYDV